MSTNHYNKRNSWIGFFRESVPRNGDAAIAAGATIYAFDLMEDYDIKVQNHEYEEKEVLDDSLLSGDLVRKAHEPIEVPLDMTLQTGRMLYYAMGNCVTTGTDHQTGIGVTGVAGSVVTCGGESWTPDEHIGRLVEVTSGDQAGSKYHITDNAADTLTVTPAPSADLNGDTIKITKAPWTHLMTSGSTVRTFALKLEQEGDDTTSMEMRDDLLGCATKAWEALVEEKGLVEQSVTAMGLKTVPGNDLTAGRPSNLQHARLKYENLNANDFKWLYDHTNADTDVGDAPSEDVQSDYNVLRFRVGINVVLGEEPVLGDAFAKTWNISKRDYEVEIKYLANNNVIKNLARVYNTEFQRVTNVAPATPGTQWQYPYGRMSLEWTFKRGADDYIKFTFNTLRIEAFEEKITGDGKPSEDTVTMRVPPDGSCVVEVKDDLDINHYEGPGEA